MPLLEEFAAIHPDLHTRDFWEACGRHELQFQRCGACGTFRSPPMTGCRHCGSTEVEWVVVSGRGRVFSHTTVVHPALPEIAGDVPYNVVVVEFDDAPGARLISNVLDTPPTSSGTSRGPAWCCRASGRRAREPRTPGRWMPSLACASST